MIKNREFFESDMLKHNYDTLRLIKYVFWKNVKKDETIMYFAVYI